MPATTKTPENITQLTYQSTEYADTSWEIVGEKFDRNEFEPSTFEVTSVCRVGTDPMFADFGGRTAEGGTQLWHLPAHLAMSGAEAKTEEVDRRIKILPEDLEKLKAELYEKAKAEGFAEADALNKERLGAMEQALQTVVQDVSQQLTENLAAIQRDAVKLVVEISEKIIEHAVEVNPEYIGALVKEALSRCGTAQIKRVRISPQDMEFVEVVGLGSKGVPQGDGWNFEADPSIRSGCVVETTAGEIDFRIDEAWNRMKSSIVKVIK